MSSLTRNQEYKYQYKVIAVANQYFCGHGPHLAVSVPENLLDIKAIFMHAVVRFSPHLPQERRKILWVGCDYLSRTGVLFEDDLMKNMVKVEVKAHSATGVAEVKIDITHLKDKILAALASDTYSFDQPRIRLSMITDLTFRDTDGELILWKIDFAYTTTGIQ